MEVYCIARNSPDTASVPAIQNSFCPESFSHYACSVSLICICRQPVPCGAGEQARPVGGPLPGHRVNHRAGPSTHAHDGPRPPRAAAPPSGGPKGSPGAERLTRCQAAAGRAPPHRHRPPQGQKSPRRPLGEHPCPRPTPRGHPRGRSVGGTAPAPWVPPERTGATGRLVPVPLCDPAARTEGHKGCARSAANLRASRTPGSGEGARPAGQRRAGRDGRREGGRDEAAGRAKRAPPGVSQRPCPTRGSSFVLAAAPAPPSRASRPVPSLSPTRSPRSVRAGSVSAPGSELGQGKSPPRPAQPCPASPVRRRSPCGISHPGAKLSRPESAQPSGRRGRGRGGFASEKHSQSSLAARRPTPPSPRPPGAAPLAHWWRWR